MLLLHRRAQWNGCVAQTVLYSEDPINLTCTGEKRFYRSGEKRFDTDDHWTAAVSGDDVRRIYLAVSNCRSSTGLLLHYRLTVHGNIDSTPCSNSATHRSRRHCFAIAPLLFLLLML